MIEIRAYRKQAMPFSSNMESLCVFYLLFITARQIQYSTAKPKKTEEVPAVSITILAGVDEGTL